MTHYNKSVKAKCDSDAKFFVNLSQHCRKPSSFSRVKEKENYVMFLNKVFKLLNILNELLISVFGNGVSGHRNIHRHTLSFDFGVDLRDSPCCNLSFEVIVSSAIFEGKQALSHRIAVANSAIVNKCELYVSPAE